MNRLIEWYKSQPRAKLGDHHQGGAAELPPLPVEAGRFLWRPAITFSCLGSPEVQVLPPDPGRAALIVSVQNPDGTYLRAGILDPAVAGIRPPDGQGPWQYRRAEWGLLVCEAWTLGSWPGVVPVASQVWVRDAYYG